MARPSKQSSASAPGQINMIGEGTVVEGTLRAHSDIRVSGQVVGRLEVEGKVMIAQEGAVDGELIAQNADVAGRVEGDLIVAERLMLKSSAYVDGNVSTQRLVMEEGATFLGKCEMGEAAVRRHSEQVGQNETAGKNGTASKKDKKEVLQEGAGNGRSAK